MKTVVLPLLFFFLHIALSRDIAPKCSIDAGENVSGKSYNENGGADVEAKANSEVGQNDHVYGRSQGHADIGSRQRSYNRGYSQVGVQASSRSQYGENSPSFEGIIAGAKSQVSSNNGSGDQEEDDGQTGANLRGRFRRYTEYDDVADYNNQNEGDQHSGGSLDYPYSKREPQPTAYSQPKSPRQGNFQDGRKENRGLLGGLVDLLV